MIPKTWPGITALYQAAAPGLKPHAGSTGVPARISQVQPVARTGQIRRFTLVLWYADPEDPALKTKFESRF